MDPTIDNLNATRIIMENNMKNNEKFDEVELDTTKVEIVIDKPKKKYCKSIIASTIVIIIVFLFLLLIILLLTLHK